MPFDPVGRREFGTRVGCVRRERDGLAVGQRALGCGLAAGPGAPAALTPPGKDAGAVAFFACHGLQS